MTGLFINQLGRIVCVAHGGSYLQSSLEKHPSATTINTPLDRWDRLSPEDIEEFSATCEECR